MIYGKAGVFLCPEENQAQIWPRNETSYSFRELKKRVHLIEAKHRMVAPWGSGWGRWRHVGQRI
jgi:hypothetical protein